VEKDITLGTMPGIPGVGRRQWLHDVTDWTKIELPRLVNLAENREEYRSFVHRTIQAPDVV